MSVNITTTTTTTTTYSSDQDALFPGAGNLPGNTFNPESSDILLGHGNACNQSNLANTPPVPDSLKDAILSMMGLGVRLPSDSGAAQTIENFQKEKNTGLLSANDMKNIADTGYYKDKDGNLKPASDEVQLAAKAMMANGGALFKRLESANTGKHDGLLGSQDFPAAIKQGIISANPHNAGMQQPSGLGNDFFMQMVMQGLLSRTRPSEYEPSKTIDSFMKDKKIDLLSATDMKNIADTGFYKDKSGNLIPVDENVQTAAKALMANGGELFKKLEAANTGTQDGLLGQKDFSAAVRNGSLAPGNNSVALNFPTIVSSNNVLPSAYSAGNTADRFMKDNNIELLSASDMKRIADTGYYKDKDGQLKRAPDDMQAAAQALMANGGQLFKQLEAANTGEQDGLLGQKDFAAAVRNGSLNAATTTPTFAQPNNVLPSAYSAGNTADRFMKDKHIDLLSAGDMKNIADTGYYKDKDGQLKPASADMQAAAQALMANGGQLFKQLEAANTGEHDGLLGQKDFAAAVKNGSLNAGMGTPTFNAPNNVLPSAYSAGSTMDHFLKDNKIGLLSASDMQNIADTGYCKDKNGNLKPVAPEVQAAAQALMANGGELFKKLESANTGKQDGLLGQKDFAAALRNGSLDTGSAGTPTNYPTIVSSNNVLPSAYSAGNTMDHFLKDNKIGLQSASDIKNIADTGYYKDKNGDLKPVSAEVQAAAQALMANGGQLFKQLEAANTGKQDGLLGQKDFAAAVQNGSLNAAPTLASPNNVLPSAYGAGNTVDRFMKDNNVDLLSASDMKSIADTGYYKDKDGQLKAVSPEVQAAAQALMANGGQLFKQLEAANTGEHDGLLGQKDFAAAVKNGSLNAGVTTPTFDAPNNVLPSAHSAGNTIDHFLKDNKIDLLSASDMKSIADTGYYKDKNGDLKPVSAEVQAAAQALMANGGELFKQLEAANTGKHDGLLGQKDYGAAVANAAAAA